MHSAARTKELTKKKQQQLHGIWTKSARMANSSLDTKPVLHHDVSGRFLFSLVFLPLFSYPFLPYFS